MKNNVLVLSAGRRVSLVKAFQKAIADLSIDGDVFGADMKPSMSAACNVLSKSFVLPHVLKDEYIEELKKLCLKESIKMVVPTIDTELLKLAEFKQEFKELDITIVVSDSELVIPCRDKRLTHELFDEIGFPVPITYSLDNIIFPCFSKPISGSLSQNIRILQSQEELDTWDVPKSEMMYMEIVSNQEFDEYTVDVYYTQNSELICMVPRQRVEVRGGEISKGRTNKELVNLLKGPMSKITTAFGCLTLQVFKSKTTGQIYGIEINPRFGGGFPLSNAAGARYPEFLLREVFMEEKLSYTDAWEDQLVMLRYDAEVLVSNG
ncbi:ATP-grasp domain-containing protein [Thalassotalea sp. HSM 43]|uniref:ATP-grasp domain-containing protein n=1 Tax=Thalassotalea sp. HSM 43 TaxID=2552945 RepID=UPI00107FF4FC|nr:ATP-grasp domain-containing protein [Thalassotalea sp. HSM 43]QBY03121.1 ATP-grasp domain-containing protein [Thalassotalea sp. HSM 43]